MPVTAAFKAVVVLSIVLPSLAIGPALSTGRLGPIVLQASLVIEGLPADRQYGPGDSVELRLVLRNGLSELHVRTPDCSFPRIGVSHQDGTDARQPPSPAEKGDTNPGRMPKCLAFQELTLKPGEVREVARFAWDLSRWDGTTAEAGPYTVRGIVPNVVGPVLVVRDRLTVGA